MLQITDEQKLDIAEAMSKHAGGVFYFLSDNIPAIKTSKDSKWQKIDTMDWWQIENLFPFNIEDVPSKLFSLDGAGKIKDFSQIYHHLTGSFILKIKVANSAIQLKKILLK